MNYVEFDTYCEYCGNIVDITVYKEFGIGHTKDCIVRDCWLDEDFALWSDLHIDENHNIKPFCSICGQSTEKYCPCHLTVRTLNVHTITCTQSLQSSRRTK